MEVIGICLSDIPKDKIKKAENGKCYINLAVASMKQIDGYGNDLTVYVQQSKDERSAKEPKTYIGHGKTYDFDKPKGITPENIATMPNAQTADVDDLPF